MDVSKINSSVQFAAWIKLTYPELFDALARAAQQHAKTAPVRAALKSKGLSGFLDTLSNIASDVTSGIGAAVQNVGNFITSPEGLKTMSGLATSYLQNQAQQAVLQTQLARAQAGQAPAPITYTTAQAVTPAGQAIATQIPIVQTGTGQFTYLSPATLQSYTPGAFIQQYGMWLVIGAVGLVLVFALTRR
jgi:hypothetical protein